MSRLEDLDARRARRGRAGPASLAGIGRFTPVALERENVGPLPETQTGRPASSIARTTPAPAGRGRAARLQPVAHREPEPVGIVQQPGHREGRVPDVEDGVLAGHRLGDRPARPPSTCGSRRDEQDRPETGVRIQPLDVVPATIVRPPSAAAAALSGCPRSRPRAGARCRGRAGSSRSSSRYARATPATAAAARAEPRSRGSDSSRGARAAGTSNAPAPCASAIRRSATASRGSPCRSRRSGARPRPRPPT